MRPVHVGLIVVLIATSLSACPAHGRAPVTVTLTGSRRLQAGSLLKIDGTLSSLAGRPIWTSISWGDGVDRQSFDFHGPCYRGTAPSVYETSSPSPAPVPKPPGITRTLIFAHRYRYAGHYEVTLWADEYSVCGRRSPKGKGTFNVVVLGPNAPANGPADPVAGLGIHAFKHRALWADVRAEDPDGYVRSVTVTFPDGSAQTFENDQTCSIGKSGWPVSSVLFPWFRRVNPGISIFKMTAISTDCSGGAPQTLTAIERVQLTSSGLGWSWPDASATYLPHPPILSGEIEGGDPSGNGTYSQ